MVLYYDLNRPWMYSISMKETRECTICHLPKPVSNFTINKALKSGLSSFCKSCASERRKKNYDKNRSKILELKKGTRERTKEQRRTYQQSFYYGNLERERTRSKDWRDKNPNKVKKYNKEYRETNPDKIKQLTTDYRKNNLEKVKKVKSDWRKNNPEAVQKHRMTRRARKAQNGVYKVFNKELDKLMQASCVSCGSTDQITIDHIIPVSKGGQHSIGNLQSLCKSCNSSKGTKTMSEWKNS